MFDHKKAYLATSVKNHLYRIWQIVESENKSQKSRHKNSYMILNFKKEHKVFQEINRTVLNTGLDIVAYVNQRSHLKKANSAKIELDEKS